MNTNHLQAQIDHINGQFHAFGTLQAAYDADCERYRIYYTDEDERSVGLSAWLRLQAAREYLQNYEDMFCIDVQNPRRFFQIGPAALMVPLRTLAPTQKRAQGVRNARVRMREAYFGRGAKRAPLRVQPVPDAATRRYMIVDGNSTYHVAREWGMVRVPVVLHAITQKHKNEPYG